MQGRETVSAEAKFKEVLDAMKDNEYFKEFFLFHEQSLKNGLKKLDRDAGYFGEYFAKMFMKHLEKSNAFRKHNKKAFKSLKQEKSNKMTIEQIAE